MNHAGQLRNLCKEAESQGFRVKQLNNGHWRFYSPDGVNMVVVSATPSDNRAWDNILAQLRRAGFRDRKQEESDMSSQHATTSLAEAFTSAKEETPVPLRRGQLQEIILQAMGKHPDHVHSTDEVVALVKYHGIQTERQSVLSCLATLAQLGKIDRTGFGHYRYSRETEPEIQPAPQEEPMTPPPPPHAEQPETSLDTDERELEQALAEGIAALSRLETVARRWQRKIQALRRLKAELAELSL